MELLQYKYHDAYVIQASSTDIGMSWRKFKVRAKRLPPARYCNYVMASDGRLRVYNADSKKMEEVAEADWHEACPVFFEDHKYNLTLTFFDAAGEPRIIHPNSSSPSLHCRPLWVSFLSKISIKIYQVIFLRSLSG